MKIACITVFCNEGFRLENWIRFYTEYKEDIALHIIVNNGNGSDTSILRKSFPESVVLESNSNNLLAAYNIGTKYALKDPLIDAIMQITNDVRFEGGAIRQLYDLLYSDEKLAIIGPVVLQKDSTIVESFGIDYSKRTGEQSYPYHGNSLSDITEDIRRVSYVPAGTILQKRTAIEQMGYQDENLNMYCDERDMYYRLEKIGYYEAVTRNAIAWHQHINRPGYSDRSLKAPYFSSRNSIYLLHKHASFGNALLCSLRIVAYQSLLFIYHLLSKSNRHKTSFDKAVLIGTIHGFHNKMHNIPQWL